MFRVAFPALQSLKKVPKALPGVGTVVAVLGIYVALLLVGFFSRDRSSTVPRSEDLLNANETVVLLEPIAIDPIEDRVDTEVLVIPDKSLMDPELGVLNTDITVRLYPSTQLGDIQFSKGRIPELVRTSLWALGDMNAYPFDTYATARLHADVIAGSGESLRYLNARVEVAGSLYGWYINYSRADQSAVSAGAGDVGMMTLSRSRGTVAMSLGLCLVLVALPPLALYVAIRSARGTKKFQPPFGTWFAAMLFSVVPIRNVFPGDPPPGIWIDEAVVLWVLIALVTAMVIYIYAWSRHSD